MNMQKLKCPQKISQTEIVGRAIALRHLMQVQVPKQEFYLFSLDFNFILI